MRAWFAREHAPPLLAAAVAAALTLPFLGARSFWLDESLSFALARLEWSEFTETVTERENNMTLYHLLLRGWTAVGTSEAFVRALSVLAGVAALLVFYALVVRLFGRRVAFGAALLLAVNPIFVHYSREARGFALCLALVTVASFLFVRGVERPSWWTWIGYALVSALAVYAHLFAVLVPPAHAASLLLRRERPPWRHLVVSAFAFGAALLPFYALATAAQASGIEWAAENAPGRIFVRLQEAIPAAAGAALALAVGVVAVLLGLRVRRSPVGGRPATWPWAFVLTWLFVPVALVVAISFFATPVFVVRYFIIVVPPLVLLAALLLARIGRTNVYAAGLAAAAAVSCALALTWSASAEERWEDATEYVAADARAGDGVLFFAPYVRVPFEVYLDDLPQAKGTLRAVYPETPWGGELLTLIQKVPVDRETIAGASAPYGRIWLFVSHEEFEAPTEYAALLDALDSRFRRGTERRFGDVSVVRYELSRR